MRIYDPHPLDVAESRDNERDDVRLAGQLTFAMGTSLECGTPPVEFRKVIVKILNSVFKRLRTKGESNERK